MLLVFIVSPGKGDAAQNLRNAILTAETLWNEGIATILPALHFHQQVFSPRPSKEWVTHDNEIMRRCDVVLRLPGESTTADQLVGLAGERGLPIFTSIKELTEFYREGLDVRES
jgi:hypothetical protein